MADIVYQGVTAAEYLQISSLLKRDRDNGYPETFEMGASPSMATKTAQYGSSLLLATGSANKDGRTYLIVKNNGNNVVRVGASSEASIYEVGIPIEPGETKVFKASNTVSLYARSMGYSSELEITEV